MKKGLCEICHPKQWKTISSDMLEPQGYPVYGANGVIGYYSEYNHEKATLLITCRGATCGALNICKPFSYVNGNAMALDSLSPEVDLKYLYYYLLARGLSDVITGSAQPQIVRQSLGKVIIDYPILEEQLRIAVTLDKVSDLITKRRAQLDKLDLLVKARFVEMFGAEEERKTLSDICSIITDGTHQPPKFVTEGIPFLFVSNVVSNVITYETEKYISQETYNELIKRTPIEPGDILLSTVGSYGHPAIVKDKRKFLFQRHIAYLKPNHEMVYSEYLHSALLSCDVQRQIEEKVKGVAQKTLNLSEIKKISLPIPPMNTQRKFCKFVEQVNEGKSIIEHSLDKLVILKRALMQQYFG